MSIFDGVYKDLSNKSAKFYFGIFGIVVASFFSFIQWGLPLWWERQPNFDVSFFSLPGTNIYIQAFPQISNPEQCNITGTIAIKNEGAAPISIQNTHLFFIPYNVEKCDINEELCMVSQNTPTQFIATERETVDVGFSEMKSNYHHTVIHPVTHDHDLFSGSSATRVFNLLTPAKQLNRERMLVVAVQEFGKQGCVIERTANSKTRPICKTSRATMSIPAPCQISTNNSNKADVKSSAIF
jgi:hypothetical protein